MTEEMLNIGKFYDKAASDSWFTIPGRQRGSVHDQLQDRDFTLIDRPTLESDYQYLEAPTRTVDLSYAKSIPTPTPGYKTAFLTGYAYDIKNTKLKEQSLGDLMTEWLNAKLNGEIFVMSLIPESYLLAKGNSIEFEDIFNITRLWGIDCIIGVFDQSNKSMFVFAQEFGLTHISFSPDHVPDNFDEVSAPFENVVKEGFVKEAQGRTGADGKRLEEYYEVVVKPFI